MRILYIVLSVLMLVSVILSGCENGEKETGTGETRSSVGVVGVDALDVRFMEQASNNIPVWLSGDTSDRVLVWFSAFDCLDPVSPEDKQAILRIVDTGSYDMLSVAGNINNPEHLYTSTNMNSLAHTLGIVRELIWVIPGFSSVTDKDLDVIKKNMKARFPEDAAEVDALVLKDKEITGSIQGMPVRIIALDDLHDPGEPVMVSIDASFMYALYQDEKSTKYLSFIAGMFKLMGEAGLDADYVSIAASNEDGRCPYKLRSLAGYLKEMIEDPSIARSEPPKLWKERSIAWAAEQKDAGLAVPIYKNIIANYPDDAATRYDLADAYFKLGRLDECGAALVEAAKLDPGYRGAFPYFAARLASEGRNDEADRLFSMMPTRPEEEAPVAGG